MKTRARACYPDGHFYSPVVDTADVLARREQIWLDDPRTPGIDWNDASHEALLRGPLRRFLSDYDYPEWLEDRPDLMQFYTRNSQFSWLDSRALFALLREWRPSRMVEVGSGYSTLLAADVNRRFLGHALDLTCIEPYPRPFLKRPGGLPGVSRLIEARVEQVGFTPFRALRSGDVLFIDSSHVAKTGSDVNYLFFEILPRLAPGVRIHIHDIHLPFEYPPDWVIGENRSWNEQYLVHALLMFSSGFRVVFGCRYAFHRFPDLVREALAHPRGHAFGGGSLWVERIGPRVADGFDSLSTRVRESVHKALQRVGRLTPESFRQRVRRRLVSLGVISSGASSGIPSEASDYAARAAQENARFANEEVVHDLPPIFHYWSNRYLLPMTQAMGFQGANDFFAKYLLEAAQRSGSDAPRFISVGSGNCDAEVALALALRERGLSRFTIECLDLNPTMLERGRALAAERGVLEHIQPVEGDFNHWRPDGRYDGVLANQSLHHVLELEALFDAIGDAMSDQALFITSDMIGRNGHQRWPEALAIVREFWKELPPEYRYNVQLRRREPEFLDWNCAVEGFEGIRAQDVLPLLVERFGFELFLAYGNVIDPFIDRSFGPHFDPGRGWDREFIDRVHARDETEMRAGTIKPTHVLAVMRKDRTLVPRVRENLTPEFCVRRP